LDGDSRYVYIQYLYLCTYTKPTPSINVLPHPIRNIPALGTSYLCTSGWRLLTQIIQATVAEKHGRRVVLTISLLGSAITCLFFGTSTTLQQAVCIRLLQGIFAGAVGVARGCVAFVTDPSNEGRAYAILGYTLLSNFI